MRLVKILLTASAGLSLTGSLVLGNPPAAGQMRAPAPELKSLLPQMPDWQLAEAAQSFFPETLFERIDGAAESYLAYDFQELLAADFERRGGEATLTAEIYDMGTGLNAFGIYSAERFPENRPVDIGLLGYIEGEALNFIAGRYYVKLLGFGLGSQASAVLMDFGRKIAAPVRNLGAVPEVFALFPPESIVPRSEKYIGQNFLGFEFLGRGFQVSYRFGQQEFEAFVAAFDDETQAKAALQRLLEFYAKDRTPAEATPLGWRVKTRYGQRLIVDAVGNKIAGVVRVPDVLETQAANCFKTLLRNLGNHQR